jgi:hypothetical protein
MGVVGSQVPAWIFERKIKIEKERNMQNINTEN